MTIALYRILEPCVKSKLTCTESLDVCVYRDQQLLEMEIADSWLDSIIFTSPLDEDRWTLSAHRSEETPRVYKRFSGTKEHALVELNHPH